VSAPKVKRHLRCEKGHSWQINVGDSEWCPMCDFLGEPFCACGCGASLADQRADAVYRSDACAKRLQRRGTPDIDPTKHALDEVRARGEESKEKARWALVAREQILRVLLAKGSVTASDLDPLGVPAPHVNVCSSWFGHYSRQKLMRKVGWQTSEKPSRKSSPIFTFEITDKGRAEIPGLLTDLRTQLASTPVGPSNDASGGSHVVAWEAA
jgi:hypothetical protein